MFQRLLLTALVSLFAMPFSVSAQEAVVPADLPAFLKDVQSKADFDRLTPEQQREAEAFIKGDSAGPSLAEQTVAPPLGTANCFDYYTFGSVQVDVEASVSTTVPGVSLTFMGAIKNRNPYPVIGGTVYAKVFKKQEDDKLTHQNGHFLVDQFVVKKDVTLKANGEEPITFDWDIPRIAPSGDYEIAMFFYTADRFNLLGLTFTDDVVGNKVPFAVKSDVEGEIAFDKNEVTLNGKGHRFAAFPPRFTKEESVKAEVKLANTTGKDQSVALSWTLYNWDSLRSDNRIAEKTETVVLKAGESKTLSYETREYEGAVSFLVVEAKANGQKSILDIRWVREGVSETRINFPGILKFPLKAGEPNTVFSCAHSTNLPLVENSEIEMSLKDESGKTIHEYAYRGGITGAMMGVRDEFTPERNYDTFTLSTVLKKDGQVVESLDLRYDCERIDPSLCSDERGAVTSGGDGLLGSADKGMFLAILALLVVLLAALVWKVRKGPSTRMHAFFLAALLSSGLLFGGAGEAEAKSVVAGVNGVPQLAYDWDLSGPYITDSVPLETNAWGAKWLLSLAEGASASVNYSATLIDDASGEVINDGSSIPIGTNIRVERVPAQNSDISWNGTGYASDTPYGYWVADAGSQSKACHNEDQTSYKLRTINHVTASVISYTLLDVAPTVEQLMSPSANLSCSGNVCTVTSAGPVSIGMQFPETYGRFYYRYLDHPEHYGGGCRANNTPMREIDSCPQGIEWCRDWGHGFVVKPEPYNLIIPETTISWNLAAVSGANTAPADPLIKGSVDMTTDAPLTGLTGTSYAFHFRSADSEGNDIRYGVDWNNDSLVDQWLPGAGHVASGTVQTASRSWITLGTYTLRVLAQDSNGASSGWTTHSIVIVDPPIQSNIFTICQDSCVSGLRRDGFTNMIGIGEARSYVACYGPSSTCSDVSAARSATWTEGSAPVMSLQGTNPASQITIQGDTSGTETVTADIGGGVTTTGTISIPITCISSCTVIRRAQECSGVSFPETDSCDTAETCTGTRYCDFNWKEVPAEQ